ncbi:MAG TPA: glycosyltransferase family 4 protein [Solirubrobacteraceae bacterium]|nr:glycosyltransferase family 4 protein [Solirubrobacteraceae bacterium]
MQSEQEIESAPLDVTIVAHDIGPVGGMERQLVALITGLRRRGHRVTVIARTCEMPADAGIAFHRVRGPGRPFLLAYPWFFLAGSLAVRRWRRGVVQATGAIVLNQVDVIAVHYCQQIGPATPSRSTRLSRAYSRVVGVMNRVVERRCYGANRSAVFACVSEGVADEMREHFPDARGRILAIQNGVDTELFAPGRACEQAAAMRAALHVTPERLVAAFVGGEWERKGLAAVIGALAVAPDWDLVVAGGGDAERYRALARSLGVEERVHWLGVTREVQLVYQLADALVFPSSYEAFSLVTLEAAASGLPILATPVSGVRELIEDGESGFLISQEPARIGERLQQLAADPPLRLAMGRAARASALGFSWERMVARHEQLYAQLAGAQGS